MEHRLRAFEREYYWEASHFPREPLGGSVLRSIRQWKARRCRAENKLDPRAPLMPCTSKCPVPSQNRGLFSREIELGGFLAQIQTGWRTGLISGLKMGIRCKYT